MWEVLWKLEVVKDLLNPTWMEARLPLQLLCIDDQANRLKITIWTTEKHSTSHDLIGDTGIASETRKTSIVWWEQAENCWSSQGFEGIGDYDSKYAAVSK